jgi:hypothetical protein
MNKFVLGALALTAASTPSLAGEKDWLIHDRDMEALSNNLSQETGGGATISGFIRSSYATSSDITVAPSGNDLGGFSIDDARLIVTGSIGSYGVVLEVDGSTDTDLATGGPFGGLVGGGLGAYGSTGGVGAMGVLDAYAHFAITDQIKGQIGNFRPPFLASSLRNEDGMLFQDRTFLGQAFAFRDQGVQVSGAFDMLNFAVAVQNGADGAGDELVVAGRVSFTVMGNAPGKNEGALGQGDETSLTVGVGYYNDGQLDDGTAIAVDAQFGMGALSAAFEFSDLDVDIAGLAGIYGAGEDASPYNFQVGYMVVPDEWEVAIRYEDFDTSTDTTAITAGVNWYHNRHAAKWHANYITIDDDVTDADVIQVGMTASF